VETFALPTVGSVHIYIRSGPDGNLWFTELNSEKVGLLTDGRGRDRRRSAQSAGSASGTTKNYRK
jgi:hypothetical protein